MPRPGQAKSETNERLSDRIEVGVLTRTFPPELWAVSWPSAGGKGSVTGSRRRRTHGASSLHAWIASRPSWPRPSRNCRSAHSPVLSCHWAWTFTAAQDVSECWPQPR